MASSAVEVTTVQVDGPLPLTVAGEPVWPLLMDFDLLWIDPEAASAAPGDLRLLLIAATASGLPIFTDADPFEMQGVEVTCGSSLEQVARNFDIGPAPPTPRTGLPKLQRYYARMAQAREYNTTDPREGLLLLTEEIGELAHAIRKSLDLDRTRPYAAELNVPEELADVQLFLLNLANLVGESLGDALRAKERTNQMRASDRLREERDPTRPTFVAIEGLIGAGKTTTTETLGGAADVSAVYERVESHPFIDAFYRDGLSHLLELELAFILMRWHSIKVQDGSARILADFSPHKDLVFSRVLMQDADELDLVRRLHSEMWQKLQPPDLTIFLDLQPDHALARIRSRGRPFEAAIAVEYLHRLREAYLEDLQGLGRQVVRIEVDGRHTREDVAEMAGAAIREFDPSWGGPAPRAMGQPGLEPGTDGS